MEDFGTYYLRMLGKENDELKDKINNTIEYINQIEKSGHIDINATLKELLKILEGRDKNE